jgi:hypothetical protein
MDRPFGRLGVRAHLKFSGRDHDQFDAIRAVAKRLPGQPRFAGLGGANGRGDAKRESSARKGREDVRHGTL